MDCCWPEIGAMRRQEKGREDEEGKTERKKEKKKKKREKKREKRKEEVVEYVGGFWVKVLFTTMYR